MPGDTGRGMKASFGCVDSQSILNQKQLRRVRGQLHTPKLGATLTHVEDCWTESVVPDCTRGQLNHSSGPVRLANNLIYTLNCCQQIITINEE